MQVLNLTLQKTLDSHKEAGAFDSPKYKRDIKKLLTFNRPPTKNFLYRRANDLVDICRKIGVKHVWIAPPPFFTKPLHDTLVSHGFTPFYSYLERKPVEESNYDGTKAIKQTPTHISWI